MRVILPLLSLSIATLLIGLLGIILYCRWILFQRRRPSSRQQQRHDLRQPTLLLAFFHPHCSSGGGGERVLWKAIEALAELRLEFVDKAKKKNNLEIVIYTIDPPSETYKEDLLQHVQSRFSIVIPETLPLSFVHLPQYAHFLDPAPRLSLLSESFGTMKFSWMCLLLSCEHHLAVPDVWIDTTGCAFTFFVARILAGVKKVVAYVHYPTISTDMLVVVWQRRPSYNNESAVTSSIATTYIKLIYYVVFAFLYGAVGSLADVVMVNSTWTYGHISRIWFLFGRTPTILFPPCDVASLQSIPLTKNRVPGLIVSIGQFRPEKDHAKQIRSFALLRQKYKSTATDAKLVLIGSCRNAKDQARVASLQQLVSDLRLEEHVQFVLNEPWSEVKEWFSKASIGLHTMWNEHFGIGVVELMAAGILTIAHCSGGPMTDIVVSTISGGPTGFLASTDEDYASKMAEAMSLGDAQALEIRRRARESSQRFSDQVFISNFKRIMLESGVIKR